MAEEDFNCRLPQVLISERPETSLLPSRSLQAAVLAVFPVSMTCTLTIASSSRPRTVIVPLDTPASPCLIALEIISLITNARIVAAREETTVGLPQHET